MNLVQAELCRIFRDKGSTPTQKLLGMRVWQLLQVVSWPWIAYRPLTIHSLVNLWSQSYQYSKVLHSSEKSPISQIEASTTFPIIQVKSISYLDSHLATIGNSFFRLTLENLWVWSKWFPVDPERYTVSLYKMVVMRLIIRGFNHN